MSVVGKRVKMMLNIFKTRAIGQLAPMLFIVIFILICSDSLANDENSGFMQRDTMTGNWNNFRDRLSESGVSFDLEYTGYYQGMFSGTGYDDFDFGWRADALIHFDTEKLKLWNNGNINIHLTYRSGDLPALRGGALWPVSAGSILPLGEKNSLVASSIYISQRFGDSVSLMLGKINAVDLLAGDPFFGGWGNHRFMNVAFVAPPSGVVPPVIMGAVFNYRVAPYTLTFMVFDPHDRTGDYWPDKTSFPMESTCH
jgi:porin